MLPDDVSVILGSRSPRRRDLLQALIPPDRLKILPPLSDLEQDFEGLRQPEEIEQRLLSIVRTKHDDVHQQATAASAAASAAAPTADAAWRHNPCVLCADTIVVVEEPGSDQRLVLGKPPDVDWQPVVADWFRRYYFGRNHEVWTGVRVSCGSTSREFVARTSVRFCSADEGLLGWYLGTEESVGKAGGYGIQDFAAVFVEGLEGSLSNVIGLPVRETADALKVVVRSSQRDVRP